MSVYPGQVEEILLNRGKEATARIACPQKAVPTPGRYLLADDGVSILTIPLFSMGITARGFLAAPPVPASWTPGTALRLRGPLGRGFELPARAQRLALIALGDTVSRLMPLATSALERNLAVTLFSDLPLPSLPASLEAFPLSALPESLLWANFLALDLPLDVLPDWHKQAGLPSTDILSRPGQALIVSPMPCGALAGCGVCAVETRRGWKWVCKDGPVFDLMDLV